MDRMIPKPVFIQQLERAVGSSLPVHPHWISSAKLFAVTPALALALSGGSALPHAKWVVIGLFGIFAGLDYLDGLVARERNLATWFGRVFDRVTDYPLLAVVSWHCLDVLPAGLVVAKLALDGMLLVLYAMGRGSTENRLRTSITYTTLLSLLLLSQGWAPRLVTTDVVQNLLVVNIVFSSVVALYNVGVLQKRFIADALSGANLLCGLFSMWAAAHGRFEVSLLFLMVGAAFDGFDGAAARRWGGTRFGVYSDDIADGVNYGLAPGFALYVGLSGWAGAVIGIAFATFTLGRLVFFTLEKDQADPSTFAGVPSTAGGILALSGLVLFPEDAAMVGLLVGAACVQMVSFDTQHRHLGRAVASHRALVVAMAPAAIAMVAAAVLVDVRVAVAALCVGVLGYGMLPTASHFLRAVRRRTSRRGSETSTDGSV